MLRFIDTLPASTTAFFVGLDTIPFANSRDGDLGNAWFCAEASALTYKNAAFIDQFATEKKALGWEVSYFEDEPTSAVLLCQDRVAVLAFRGTRVAGFPDLLRKIPINLIDLTTDFSVLLQPHPKRGRVHAGFFGAYTKFWNAHRKEIVQRIGGRSLFITGHSLGGAIATVAARDIELVAALYTFGSPRPGDGDFEKGFEELGLPVYRFVHSFDLVTTVPLVEMQYWHVGSILHISEGEGHAVTRRPQHSLLDSFAHNVAAFPKNFIDGVSNFFGGKLFNLPNFPMPDDALVDHAPMNYAVKLRESSQVSRQLPPLA